MKNPLVVHFGGLADTVMLLAFLKSLHTRFGVPIDVVCSEGTTRELLERQPYIGRVYVSSATATFFVTSHQRQLVTQLRRRGAGPVWVCNDRAIGQRHRLMDQLQIPPAFILEQRDCPALPGEHLIDRRLRLAQMTPPALRTVSSIHQSRPALESVYVPPLVVDPEWRSDCERWLATRGLRNEPLVLVHAGAGRSPWQRLLRTSQQRENWPMELWARVIDRVAELDAEAQILLIGTPAEARVNDAILRRVYTRRAQNVARDLPLHRMLALQERAVGMISAHTGPAHCAAALGCPLVVLSGEEEPSVCGPRSPTGLVRFITGVSQGRRSLQAIRPAEVIAGWALIRLRHRAMHGQRAAAT
jgi:ADP-heptose:LPS heptosyltransferase